MNDAFSCCHREQVSIHKKKIHKDHMGPFLKREVNAINTVIQNKKELPVL